MLQSDARRRVAPWALLLAAFVGLARPSGSEVAQERDTVVVDFYALGTDGLSVADLTAEEVTIRLDGRARAVRSLQRVTQGELPPEDPLAPRVDPMPPPFTTNTSAESARSIIVAIDDESFRPGRERTIRSALARFIGALSPRDRVALVTVPHGGMKSDLSTNHDAFSQAMSLVVGHGPQTESGQEAACRSRNVLESLEGMLSSLGGGEGPTTVVFFTSSMLGPRRDAPMMMAPGMCELQTQHFQRVGNAAARARAHFFIVQPEDLIPKGGAASENIAGVGFSGSDNPLEGIEHLAGVTSGKRMALTTAGDETLLAIARQTVTYYAATLESTQADLDGLTHGLDVRVSRSGVNVRARPMMFLPKVDPMARPTAKAPAEMLRDSRLYRDLPIRVAGFASQNSPDGRMRIIAVAEPVDPAVKLTGLAAALYDTQGRMAAQFTATEGELTAMPTMAALVAPPGTYRLRVAAIDADGRSGAADTEVVAELTPAGPLRLSSLVVGLSRGGTFSPRLVFTNEPVAIAFIDILGSTTQPIRAIVEVATTLNGPALVATQLAFDATSDPNRFTATGAVPLGALPPGDYVVRALVGVEGQPFGRVVRTIRKGV